MLEAVAREKMRLEWRTLKECHHEPFEQEGMSA